MLALPLGVGAAADHVADAAGDHAGDLAASSRPVIRTFIMLTIVSSKRGASV